MTPIGSWYLVAVCQEKFTYGQKLFCSPHWQFVFNRRVGLGNSLEREGHKANTHYFCHFSSLVRVEAFIFLASKFQIIRPYSTIEKVRYLRSLSMANEIILSSHQRCIHCFRVILRKIVNYPLIIDRLSRIELGALPRPSSTEL